MQLHQWNEYDAQIVWKHTVWKAKPLLIYFYLFIFFDRLSENEFIMEIVWLQVKMNVIPCYIAFPFHHCVAAVAHWNAITALVIWKGEKGLKEAIAFHIKEFFLFVYFFPPLIPHALLVEPLIIRLFRIAQAW